MFRRFSAIRLQRSAAFSLRANTAILFAASAESALQRGIRLTVTTIASRLQQQRSAAMQLLDIRGHSAFPPPRPSPTIFRLSVLCGCSTARRSFRVVKRCSSQRQQCSAVEQNRTLFRHIVCIGSPFRILFSSRNIPSDSLKPCIVLLFRYVFPFPVPSPLSLFPCSIR